MKKILLGSFFISSLLFSSISCAVLFSSVDVKIDKEITPLIAQTHGLRPQVLKLALEAYTCALSKGVKDDKKILTIIDYSLPSSVKRLWVLDLKHQKIMYYTLVAHGKYSGGNIPTNFSDQPRSLESSIGMFRTQGTYFGHDGYSLVLKGLEPGFNDKAESRHIIMHGAWYVSKDMINRYGAIGRSWGCPALDKHIVKPIIDTIKDHTLIFAYYPERKWLQDSSFLNC